jgi:hypothetical protein
VELPPVELTIEDDLEGGLHDLGGCSVELVQKETYRSIACILIPLGRIEPSHFTVSGRKTDHVTFAHLAEPTVSDVKVETLGNLPNYLGFTDAVSTAEKNRGGLREKWSYLEKSSYLHRGHIVFPLTFLS